MKFSELPVIKIINPEGHRWVIGFGLATIIFFLIGWSWLWVPTLVLMLFCGSFFRDPERFPPLKEGSVVSPADGRVLSVMEVYGPELAGIEKSTKVSIFMSVFNVHVNRSPAAGRVLDTHYKAGKFFSANLDKAAEENERNLVVIEDDQQRRIAFIQIAGLIARRIVCFVKPDDRLEKGERFGLIRFGSRVDLYLPTNTEIDISVGQHVKAGETIIGYLPIVD
ncbi:MAG TPA: phosphatidylserine decarboxylase family protein [Desulfarculaceae bacterium]|nr:phosphatidylserine decarboxylase family protein [Desulfarculaceae bacterium]